MPGVAFLFRERWLGLRRWWQGWVESLALERNWVPIIFRCESTGRMRVSSSRCCVGVVFVQPVIILRAWF